MNTTVHGSNQSEKIEIVQWSKLRSNVKSLIARISYDRFCRESDGWFPSIRGGQKWGSWAGPSSAETQWSEHQSDEIHPPQQLGAAMKAYLSMPIEQALSSANPFVRSLAIIDRRVGRGTIDGLEVGEADHSFVQEFYRLRVQALASKRG